jgi:4'-phosphopantetheinyl transferase EntD
MDPIKASLRSPFPAQIAFSQVAAVDQQQSPFDQECEIADKYSSEKRRREFFAGRKASQEVLTQLGVSATPILKSNEGDPIWPEGIIGSISHSHSLAVAAGGLEGEYRGLGLDLEYKHKKRNPKIFNRILFGVEKDWTKQENQFLNMLKVFSAKESCYKAFFQKYRVKLTWSDIVFSPSNNGLEGALTLNWEKEKRVFVSIEENKDYIISGVLLDQSFLL